MPLRCAITADLSLLRSRLHAFALSSGFSGERANDLIIAINEAAANILEHGTGTGVLTARRDAHGIWVEIVEPGGTLTADHLPPSDPPASAVRGFGLWIIRQLCDVVTVDHPDGHPRLRVHMSDTS
ncbi:hypothetical protein GCM10009733_084950 [Nonomuraea maheshkhaliensis]|uniref:Histidine kinase/HSP90-like ATPase domain-containing protein n=1 Tax=Nonomuraea maheshkhaliensis TaxID=419590 RepID=A0ABP4SLU2_9ACTN